MASPLDYPMDLDLEEEPLAQGHRRTFGIPRLVTDEDVPRTEAQPRVLSADEVKSIVQREINNALGGLGSKIAEDQRMAIRMYYGRPIGNEVKDRSQVVMMDVLEVIEWAMPSLMKMFTGGMNIAKFKARNEGEEEDARVATEVLNHMFTKDMDGETLIYDWFKTALLEKNGIVKAYWEDRVVPELKSFDGLTEDQAIEIMMEAQANGDEPVRMLERSIMVPSPEGPVEMPVFDLDVRRMVERKGVKVDGVPPEEFLIARRSLALNNDTAFAAHRKKYTVSDLVSMGFDYAIVSRIPSDDTPEYSQGRTERLSEDETFPIITDERADAAAREIWTTECIMHIDEDADGFAEMRKILLVGGEAGEIIQDDQINEMPFVSICPVRMPHKFYGQSLADLVIDLQVISSTLVRQILDHIYLSNNPRLAIVEGMVEIDDLLTVRPGGLIRQRAPGQIEPIQLPPLPPEAFKALEYMATVRNNRTGVMAHGQELDASAINTTATGISAVMAEKQQKIELIARMFALGLKQLFRKMLKLLVENDSKERQIQIAGEWITYNPSKWNAEMDLDIEVGLGAGKAIERIGNLGTVMEVQEKMVKSGGMDYLITADNLYNSATDLAEAVGHRDPERYFTNPMGKEPPKPPPDPEMKKIELDSLIAQKDAEKDRNAHMLAMAKEQNLQEYRMLEMAKDERLERARIESQERNALGQQDSHVEGASIAAGATMASARIQANARSASASAPASA